jgi:hypothetical protein
MQSTKHQKGFFHSTHAELSPPHNCDFFFFRRKFNCPRIVSATKMFPNAEIRPAMARVQIENSNCKQAIVALRHVHGNVN